MNLSILIQFGIFLGLDSLKLGQNYKFGIKYVKISSFYELKLY